MRLEHGLAGKMPARKQAVDRMTELTGWQQEGWEGQKWKAGKRESGNGECGHSFMQMGLGKNPSTGTAAFVYGESMAKT